MRISDALLPEFDVEMANTRKTLERIPEDDRPAHMAWYNMALNAAILLGSLIGPLIAGWTGIVVALFLFAVCRIISGIAILRWG